MDFDSLAPEQREEWRRHEITSRALSMLREAENTAANGVTTSAEVGTLEEIRFAAGYRRGIGKAIDLLTRERNEKQAR